MPTQLRKSVCPCHVLKKAYIFIDTSFKLQVTGVYGASGVFISHCIVRHKLRLVLRVIGVAKNLMSQCVMLRQAVLQLSGCITPELC
jgi:hypothetical protein